MTETGPRVALLTGCGRGNGIGNATAKALARAGVNVAVTGLKDHTGEGGQDGLALLVQEIEAAGGQAFAATGDIRSEEDVRHMFGQAVDHFGRVDILVSVAAAPHGADRDEVDNVPTHAWDDVMNINARGPFMLAREVLPGMRTRRWGRIVNIASAIVTQPRRLRTVYQASKSALVGFTNGLAFDVADQGITVNAISPGSILTARAYSTARRSGFANPQDAFAETAKTIPAGRHGMPEEIADAVVFLAAETSGYITGQTLTIDGGGIPQYKR